MKINRTTTTHVLHSSFNNADISNIIKKSLPVYDCKVTNNNTCKIRDLSTFFSQPVNGTFLLLSQQWLVSLSQTDSVTYR